MLARVLLANIIIIVTCVISFAQVFHHKTGHVIPTDKTDTVIWKTGTYDGYPANFGTLIVNETNKKGANRITIPVVHIESFNKETNSSPIFVLNGGPGESNLRNELIFEDIVANHDVVLMGYRGVDGSINLKCPELTEQLFSDRLTFQNADSLFELAFSQCLESWNYRRIDFDGYVMDYVVRDLEVLRKCMHYDQIHILAFSYGTMLAQLYNIKFPGILKSAILIAARPLEDFWFSSSIIKQQIQFIGDSILHNESFYRNILMFLNDADLANSNPISRGLFVFSNLYSNEGLNALEDGLDQYKNQDIKALEKSYRLFCKSFPGEMVVGDMLLKKQGRIKAIDTAKNTMSDFSDALNSWYSIKNKGYAYKVDTVKIDSLNVLLINNEYDIASPKSLLESGFLPFYPNARNYNLSGTSHLDLFFSESVMDSVKDVMIKYFYEQE